MTRVLTIPSHRARGLPAFTAIAATVVGASVMALARSADAVVVTTAVTIDIVVVLPILYYVLIVRGRGVPVVTLLPVLRLCLAAAGFVLPPDGRWLYDMMVPAARLIELGMATFVMYRLQLGFHAFRAAATGDVLERFTAGVRAALPGTVPSGHRAADAIAFEAALVWYGIRVWGPRPEVPAGAAAFTGHRKSGHAGVAAALLMVMGIEMTVVHLLVSTWSVVAAWVITAITAYGAVWVVGDLQAIRNRPSWVKDNLVCMRLGLRWSITVPSHQILATRKLRPGEAVAEALRLALPNAPRVLVQLKAPATAIGVYGMRRQVEIIELGLDEPADFLRNVTLSSERLEGAGPTGG